jgi:hypothetical protein
VGTCLPSHCLAMNVFSDCTNSGFLLSRDTQVKVTLRPTGSLSVSLSVRHPSCDQYLFFFLNYLWPPLWSNGQSSWLQIQRSGFDSQRYQNFWEVVDLERGPHSLVSTIEELFGRKNNGSGSLYPQKLALTSSTSGGRSLGIVRSRTQATEFKFNYL